MKSMPRPRWWSWVGFSLLVASLLASAAEVSVKDLTANPAKFDGQTVTLRGTAIAVKAITREELTGAPLSATALDWPGGEQETPCSWR